MGYWIDMSDQVMRTMGVTMHSFMGGFDHLAGKIRNEFLYLRDRKDLYMRSRELRGVIACLGNEKDECYCERGPIYRRDIRDVMHRVALIKAECRRIQREMDACRGHGR